MSEHHVLPEHKQRVLDSLAPQFQLSPQRLHDITKKFLEEYALGLAAYNKPMAMIRMPSAMQYTALQ